MIINWKKFLVGRGLRRTSYQGSPQSSFSEPEYVNIFDNGDFDLNPFPAAGAQTTSSSSPLSEWHIVNVTGVVGAPSAPLPLPLSGDTEGSEDNEEDNNDESKDSNDNDDDNGNSDDEEDGDREGNNYFGVDSFLINKLIRRSSYCKYGCLQFTNLFSYIESSP